MAYTMKLFSLTFMAACICFFFLLAMESHSLLENAVDPKMVAGEIIKSRKVQWVELRSGNDGDDVKKNKVEWELREAPMGPDPLHHHGGTPINRTRNQP